MQRGGKGERERVRVTERGKDSEKKREMRTEEIERDCVWKRVRWGFIVRTLLLLIFLLLTNLILVLSPFAFIPSLSQFVFIYFSLRRHWSCEHYIDGICYKLYLPSAHPFPPNLTPYLLYLFPFYFLSILFSLPPCFLFTLSLSFFSLYPSSLITFSLFSLPLSPSLLFHFLPILFSLPLCMLHS